MSKRNRLENSALCSEVKKRPCEACGREGISEVHHIVTRARLGPDTPWNLMALCGPFGCHRLWHDKPLSEFLVRFPDVHENLVSRGFFWDSHFKKLIPPRE